MFTYDVIGQIVWSSFANSSYMVLFSLAFALVLKVNGVFNFAQAAVMTAAFYAAFSVVGIAEGPGWLGLAASLAGAGLLGALIERVGFRRLRVQRASPLFVFIFALILSELVAYGAMLIFGTYPTTVFPSLAWSVLLVGNIAVSAWDIPAVLAMLGASVGLYLYLTFTRLGRCTVAVADNPDLAELYGIDKDRVSVVCMLIAGLLAGLGMFLFGTRAPVQPMTAIELMLFAIVSTIIGGIGNLPGAGVAAVVLSIIQNGSVLFIPSQWLGLLLYVFLFVAIIFFPKGVRLPQRRFARRAEPVAVGRVEG
jgi:branched-subunit amino acid ABC-type transport system permease component